MREPAMLILSSLVLAPFEIDSYLSAPTLHF